MSSESIKVQTVHNQLSSVEGGKYDYDKFVSFFTEDGTYQFGNFNPHTGRQAIKDSFWNLRGQLRGDLSKVVVDHEIHYIGELDDKVLVHMDTIYNIDGEERLRVPCFAMYTFEGDKIKKLQTFNDMSMLFMDTSALAPYGKPFKGLFS